jgi:hypothetical protein
VEELNLIDYGLVPVVIVLVQQLKKHVQRRWIPVLPLAVSFVLAGLAVLGWAGWPGWPAFIGRTCVEGLKVGFASMGLFKVWHTTIKGE